MGERVDISGSVERITFYNEENGYTVLRLQPDVRGMLPYAHGKQLVTVVGNLPEVNPGEWLKLTGQWLNHAKHGRQFQVELCEQSVPASVEGIKRYLGSGMVRGVGKVMAERIVNRFGADTLTIIDENPQRLGEVLGIGRKRVDSIIKAWEEQRAIKDVMIFLQGHGISTHLAVKIYKQYGDESLAVVQTTPYRLVQDIHGIGFKTADKIAQALGLAADDPARIEAGIHYTLSKMADDGHVYAPQDELEPEAAGILQVPAEKVTAVLESLENSDLVRRETITYRTTDDRRQTTAGEQANGEATAVREERAVYLPALYFSETGLTRQVQRLIEHPTSRLSDLRGGVQMATSIGRGVNGPSFTTLTAQQGQAVNAALTHKLTILTGGPGTGKTTTLRTLLDILDATGHSYALASPTGRAAKRLTEATGREAKTIHRLLEFKPGEGFGRNENNPIDADLIVIDETSMLDLVLAYNLLRAIGSDSHLLLVGDIDQLPSVGAGDVLRDLIASDVAAVVRLETIFRQAAGSLIIRNAHRINQGHMPETRPDAEDFFLFIKEDPGETAELLVDIVAKRIPHKFGLDPIDDVQVLAPMYNGLAGVTRLNGLLQEALNPPAPRKMERRIGGRVFRVGDKVMQTVNNYDKSVYNGDIGRVTAMDAIEQTLTVAIDGAPVVYGFLEVDELIHAFAVSVHKSQGSEYPCVVIPVVVQHYMMLQRNLLYTAVTRARRLAILVGTRRALQIAVRTNPTAQRHTALDWRLKN
ncbi:MAG: ATP-dependent RecD-like DNA helicase [Anaerolineales bacterium]|uniref:SF1B family DNA helicase RecD2 n=1 Tax=Promineifilum sp. TaxID=2664178 RepID=UPI001D91CDDD|nr:ATP-dependent RecD-like DNA helicase [Anaerolineales bacterium]MCB8935681.1 ATP-dependent RecD-like DNA helicase [Promineifilum sp.]MCO5181965.1 ATP-dependent RecD-like DNA helicase [Promineifilum sp.]